MGFFPMFSLASLLLILISTSLARAAFPESKTNTTTYDETIAEHIEGEEEEVFFGGLAAYPSKYISYRGLQKPPICNANIYGNCIQPIGKSNRPCTLYTRCKRGLK
ncbi:protein RALF-like 27 [Durio zibethinus]|uniref:Protein RALF-like 27 n=1 Tax=Durio zibethinus TaxID=66656 RepID=A0A6P5XI97_DURZI|nr:protein RALF-like 27 [Durio zibethinus]